MNKKYLTGWLLTTGSLFLGLSLYPFLPPLVASHWGLSGQVNGYQSKLAAVFLLPAVMAVILLALRYLPAIDPLQQNIKQFRHHYDSFVLFLVSFLAYVNFLVLIWNLGLKFNIMIFLTPAFASFIYGLGTVMPLARPNWLFGIRTPWTMSDGRVWFHTHELAGRVYKAAGVLSLGAFFWPTLAIYFLIVPIVSASLYLVIFSYLDWRIENM